MMSPYPIPVVRLASYDLETAVLVPVDWPDKKSVKTPNELENFCCARCVSFRNLAPSPPVFWGRGAYSCLASLADGTVGMLYETGQNHPYEKLTFARFNLEWLQECELHE